MGHINVTFFGTEEVDIGSLQDELRDEMRSLFGMMEGDIGVGYMAWKWICISLKSWMGCPDGSGTKTKSYKPVP
jgi:hypothetical protein